MRAAFFCPVENLPAISQSGHEPFMMGLAYVAAAAEAEGVEVVARTNCTTDQLIREFRGAWRSFDVVCLQVFVTNWACCEQLARIIKEANPRCQIIAGGVHPTNFPDRCLESGVVDWIVRGEADLTIRKLLRHLMAELDPAILAGLAVSRSGRTIVNAPGEIVHDLDTLPFPAWHLLYPQQRRITTGHILTSRGCPFHCAQCPMARLEGTAVRESTVNRVRAEVDILTYKHKVRHIVFFDETFTLRPDRVSELCGMLRDRTTRVTWSCFTRPQLVTQALIEEMFDAGCREIFYGLGTSSERLMEILESNIDLARAEGAVRWARSCGMRTIVAFSLGIPEETLRESVDTIRYGLRLNADRTIFQYCYPYPGSRLYETARHAGTFLTADWSAANQGALIFLPDGRRAWELKLLRASGRTAAKLFRPRFPEQ